MKRLAELIPGRMSTQPEDLLCYGFDASGLEAAPSAVVWPQSVDDVVKVVKFAFAGDVPIIPRGAGSGMTGGTVPSKGAIILSLERMNRILEIDRENMTALVEPGVINGKFQRELERHKLFYPPDPASMQFCTIGGNVAENSGGPRALKYGVTRDYVMGLEAVLPDGRIIHTGVKTAKGVVGYDLTRLLVGSEGTLAVITKIRLKVLPMPDEIVTLLALFREVEKAGDAVRLILGQGIIPRTLEFLDSGAVHAVEKYSPVGFPQDAAALLLIELDGHPQGIVKEAARVTEVCRKLGGEVIMAEDEAAREKIWKSRRAVSPALYHLKPAKISEDIVVPRNRITEMLGILKRLGNESGITIINFGHAGDGNIHVNLMIDRNNKEEYEKAQRLVAEIFRATLNLGGTISGEHGIGLTKSAYISMEIPPAELELMKKIKGIFDPKNILNPGKIFPV
ncbi:MAG: FAD-binding protein [Nitrospiraceae bacterium]|nr:FAD-binding protein [Nitrospiraceae bacterium]